MTKREPRGLAAEGEAPRPALRRPLPPASVDLFALAPVVTPVVLPGRVAGEAHPQSTAHLCRPARRVAHLSPAAQGDSHLRSPPPLPVPPRPRDPAASGRLCPREPSSRSPGPGGPPVPSRPAPPGLHRRPARSALGAEGAAAGPGNWGSRWTRLRGGGRRGRCCEKPRGSPARRRPAGPPGSGRRVPSAPCGCGRRPGPAWGARAWRGSC